MKTEKEFAEATVTWLNDLVHDRKPDEDITQEQFLAKYRTARKLVKHELMAHDDLLPIVKLMKIYIKFMVDSFKMREQRAELFYKHLAMIVDECYSRHYDLIKYVLSHMQKNEAEKEAAQV